MDPIQYLVHLLDQGLTVESAMAHVKQRYGLSDDAVMARIIEARAAAWDLLSRTDRLL